MELNATNFHRYKNGFMSVDERLDFEELLEEHPEAYAQLADHKDNFLENIAYNKEIFSKKFMQDKTKPSASILDKIFILVKANKAIFSSLLIVIISSLFYIISRFLHTPPSAAEISQLIGKGIKTSELGVIHAGSILDDPTDSDTLCNCGSDQLRARFLNDDQDKKEFNEYLKTLQTSNAYQNLCQKYWQGWAYISRQAYKESIPLFNEVKSQQSNGALSQRAAHALIIAYLKVNDTKKAVEVSDQVIDQPVYDRMAYNFAKDVKELLE